MLCSQAAKEFEEKVANPIADATQEASGLNAEQINRTAGAAKNDEVCFVQTCSLSTRYVLPSSCNRHAWAVDVHRCLSKSGW